MREALLTAPVFLAAGAGAVAAPPLRWPVPALGDTADFVHRVARREDVS